MKRIAFASLVVLAVLGAIIGCQSKTANIAGTWQGTEYIPDPKTGVIVGVPVTMTFGDDDSYSVSTDSSIGHQSADGTYNVAGDKLTTNTGSQSGSVSSGSTFDYTFTLSGKTLTLSPIFSKQPTVLTKQ